MDAPQEITTLVADPQETLETLTLSWTLDGVPYDGPTNADSNGSVSFTLGDVGTGCHTLEVTVTDLMGQSASDSGELVLLSAEVDRSSYMWWTDADEDGWGRTPRLSSPASSPPVASLLGRTP